MSAACKPDPNSLERIIPRELDTSGATGQSTLELHMERYRFAARHLRPGTLLDIACGVGYGTAFLVDNVARIEAATGVDLSAPAIDYAHNNYAHPKTSFVLADAMQFRGDGAYDSIVSLETIEHLPDPRAFVARLASMLRPGGVLIGSVPVTPSMDGNPHHLSDFSVASFRALGEANGLHELDSFQQRQPFNPFAILSGQEKRVQRDHPGLLDFYRRYPSKALLRLWSTARYGFENRYLSIAWTK